MNDSSATPKVFHTHVHPDADKDFRAIAASSEYLKAQKKQFRMQCTQRGTTLEKPRKCSKCKSGWYCSEECQKKAWPTHKLSCRNVERSSGAFKFIRMFALNPLLMRFLRAGIIFDCGLLDDPRIGFDVPFVARVVITIEPSDILDFIGLYLDHKTVGQRLQGMVQVNAIIPCHPSTFPLMPKRLQIWREERAKCDADGFANDPVGLLEYVDGTTYAKDSCQNTVTSGLYTPTSVFDWARRREPFIRYTAVTGTPSKQPMNAVACLEYINVHIREDTQNQLRLRTEMTEQDKEIVRAAGRNEDALPDPARILKEKMQRESVYTNIVHLTR
ncbi:uncharacterized protein EDB91DRAFT_1257171 [Suillus paluster]|uniref:uncharacterized protein n=1 Tax=Suillus paluster TaxID=48578 RepID=UPI001B8685F6|nr:uncharacterized protein EDB91DRAFT_1257171 [Suillus paluster]KAG1720117.1 hypothetical protein EDB91DRAFT_1257171 [Suillus paluster]